jgi:hypothetical protein
MLDGSGKTTISCTCELDHRAVLEQELELEQRARINRKIL